MKTDFISSCFKNLFLYSYIYYYFFFYSSEEKVTKEKVGICEISPLVSYDGEVSISLAYFKYEIKLTDCNNLYASISMSLKSIKSEFEDICDFFQK